MLKKILKALSIILFALIPCGLYAGDYVIGEGDMLQISVWNEKELSLSVKVRPDGKITVPALGEVAAANTTPKNLQSVLASRLRGLVKNPVVTVIVEEITNNKVYVFGGGVKSGVYSLVQRTTLLQLLCQIEDMLRADLKRAYVEREGRKIKVDFYTLFVNGETGDDLVIEPNDVIFIPASTEKDVVYVVGAVATPKFIPFREGLTVMEAILDAGGFTKFANPNDTVIYRKSADMREVAISVKIKNLINGGDLRQNAKLKPGDYIIVKEGIF